MNGLTEASDTLACSFAMRLHCATVSRTIRRSVLQYERQMQPMQMMIERAAFDGAEDVRTGVNETRAIGRVFARCLFDACPRMTHCLRVGTGREDGQASVPSVSSARRSCVLSMRSSVWVRVPVCNRSSRSSPHTRLAEVQQQPLPFGHAAVGSSRAAVKCSRLRKRSADETSRRDL